MPFSACSQVRFKEALETVLARCAENDIGAWWLLVATPRLCLPVCPEGADSFISTLCRMFQSGEWKTLLEFAVWREEVARKLKP